MTLRRYFIKHAGYFKNKDFLLTLFISIFMLIVAVIINFYSTMYATERASSSVTDIILSNIRTFDLDGLFLYGPVVFWIIMTIICFWRPQQIPFTFKSLALFIIVRSVFTSLTHIGPFPTQAILDTSNIITRFSSGSDLFFSAHTGLPFLMALVFWDDYYVRLFCLAASVFFGTVVLLGHFHYSIDVLSAFFITYSIYHLAVYFFKKDFVLFGEK